MTVRRYADNRQILLLWFYSDEYIGWKNIEANHFLEPMVCVSYLRLHLTGALTYLNSQTHQHLIPMNFILRQISVGVNYFSWLFSQIITFTAT